LAATDANGGHPLSLIVDPSRSVIQQGRSDRIDQLAAADVVLQHGPRIRVPKGSSGLSDACRTETPAGPSTCNTRRWTLFVVSGVSPRFANTTSPFPIMLRCASLERSAPAEDDCKATTLRDRALFGWSCRIVGTLRRLTMVRAIRVVAGQARSTP